MSVTVDMSGKDFDLGEWVRVFDQDGRKISGVVNVKINEAILNARRTATVEFILDDVIYPSEAG